MVFPAYKPSDASYFRVKHPYVACIPHPPIDSLSVGGHGFSVTSEYLAVSAYEEKGVINSLASGSVVQLAAAYHDVGAGLLCGFT